MKKLLSLFLALVLCLGLSACGGGSADTPTTAPTEPKQLVESDILGEWIVADDGLAVITFNADGTCAREGGEKVKYKVETDLAVLTIYYSTPQSYNIEKVGEHYRLTGEHFLFREAEVIPIQRVAEQQEKYEQAIDLLSNHSFIFDKVSLDEINDSEKAYALFAELGNYRDSQEYYAKFISLDIMKCTNGYGEVKKYDANGNMVHEVHFYSEGGSRHYKAEYDAENRVIKFDNVNYGCFYYHYDEQGNTNMKVWWPNKATDRGSLIKYYYSDTGVLEKTEEYLPDSNVWPYMSEDAEPYIIELYDDHGNILQKINYNIIWNFENIYDNNDRLIKVTVTQPQASPKGDTTTYVYNDNGILQREEQIIINSYDFNGVLTESYYSSVITYDEDGKTVMSILTEGYKEGNKEQSTTITRTYQYNDLGKTTMITEKTVCTKNGVQTTEETTETYYSYSIAHYYCP